MWTYNNEPVTEETIGDHYGFVYIITNKLNGRKYIGRKYFTKAGYKTVKGKRKKIRKQSDWMDYWGSNKKLLDDILLQGKDNFDRQILTLCKTRTECNYWELHHQVSHQVLLSEAWYNEWISVKISKKNILGKKPPGLDS